jgi:hypothetical protein
MIVAAGNRFIFKGGDRTSARQAWINFDLVWASALVATGDVTLFI